MKYFIIASSYDGQEVKEFDHKPEAEAWCVEYLTFNRDNNGSIDLVVYGKRIEVTPVETVSKISLVG